MNGKIHAAAAPLQRLIALSVIGQFMNDFTEEELERIHGCLIFTYDEVSKYICNEKEHTGILINKVKSMIDNYCEHERTIEYRLPTPVNVLFSDKECKFFVCKKCFRCVVYE